MESTQNISNVVIHLKGVETKLDTVTRVSEAITVLLRDATVSAHGFEVAGIELRRQIIDHLSQLKVSIDEIKNILALLEHGREDLETLVKDLAETGQAVKQIDANLCLLMGTKEDSSRVVPALDAINEILHCARDLNDRDKMTGEKLEMSTLLARHIKRGIIMGLAAAILALAYSMLAPHLPWSKTIPAPTATQPPTPGESK